MSQPQHQHVRRVVLPSGKTVEVVYFQPTAMSSALTPETVASTVSDLHLCEECHGPFAYPVGWEQAGPEHWQVTLRCSNCEWRRTGVFHEEVIDLLDEDLEDGYRQLARDLKRVTRVNMQEEIDRFVRALEDDHILPMDF
jgi:hypothetical protein